VTAAKFKPLIFSVWGLALSNVANIFIFTLPQLLYIDKPKGDLSSKRALDKDATVIVNSNKHLVMKTRRGSTPRHTD
jgi:hypothetical protein